MKYRIVEVSPNMFKVERKGCLWWSSLFHDQEHFPKYFPSFTEAEDNLQSYLIQITEFPKIRYEVEV